MDGVGIQLRKILWGFDNLNMLILAVIVVPVACPDVQYLYRIQTQARRLEHNLVVMDSVERFVFGLLFNQTVLSHIAKWGCNT